MNQCFTCYASYRHTYTNPEDNTPNMAEAWAALIKHHRLEA